MTPEQRKKVETCSARGRAIIEAALARLQDNPADYPYDDVHATISRLEEIQFHGFYSEPGYDLKEHQPGIMVGNANNPFNPDREKFPYGSEQHTALMKLVKEKSLFSRVFKALDRVGYEFEWCDEWQACDNCYGLVRISPDCYGWQQHFYRPDDCTCVCGECVLNDETETNNYLEWLEGNCKRAVTFNLDLAKCGYVKVKDDFEHGLHHGQDADPKLIAAALLKAGAGRFIFSIDSTGQFDFKFSVWIHKTEYEKAKQAVLTPATCDGPSVSEAMKRGLQQASIVSAALPDGPGVKYTKITGDTAKATLIPPDEFIEHGTKLAEQRLDEAT